MINTPNRGSFLTFIRTASPADLPALTVIDGADERNAATAEYLTGLLEKKCTRPEWCFVAEDLDRGPDAVGPLGNIVMWSMPGADVPSDFVLFEAPWDDPEHTVARDLLDHAFEFAKSLGATGISHMLDLPAQAPQFQTHAEQRQRVYAEAGMSLARDGHRFSWTAGESPMPRQDERLTWRTYAELGDGPFVDLCERILSDTKDSLFQADIAKLGLRGAAELLWEDSKGFEYEPEWYEIGYDDTGAAAVASLPARNAMFAVIGFVGVDPAHRGKGYAASVVARGTKLLAESGATEIRGDCDAANVGMYKGFLKSGYANFADRKAFHIDF